MRRSARLIVPVALLSPLLLLVLGAAVPASALDVAVGVHAATVMTAAAAMAAAARRGDPRLRRARSWFAAAMAMSGAAVSVSALYLMLFQSVPLASPATLAPLLWVPCALAGLLSVPSAEHREGGRLRALLDGVVVTAAMASLFWMLFLEPIYVESEVSRTATTVLLVHAGVELVLAVVALAVAGHAGADVRRFLHLGVVGLLLVALADSGGALSTAAGEKGFDWTNVVLQAGLAMLVCAALVTTGADDRPPGRASAAFDAALPHLPVLVAATVGLLQAFHGRLPGRAEVVLGTVMLLGLVGRQLLYASHLTAVAHRLSVDAAHDPLTGLRNRRSWLQAMQSALAGLPAGQVAVVLIDLDGFKEVNDAFGHAAGDLVLTDVGRRLQEVTDAAMVPARLGGDEFALMVVGSDAERRAVRAAEELTRGQRSLVGAVGVTVGASAGIAVSRPGDTSSDLVRRADVAMYEAKRGHGARTALFADDMARRAERWHLLTQALPGAAGRGELSLAYQPVIRLADGGLAGAEALLRWRHPLHGDVPPKEFVPLAEEAGVIDDVGRWALEQAAEDLRRWAAAGRPLPRLFVNVSPRQLTAQFTDAVVEAFAASGIAPSTVTLEITESAVPDVDASSCLERLRAAGFSVAVDHFGGGFSSLAQLGVLPVDTLKLDRELLRGVHRENRRRVVEAFVALADDLGLVTVAEGVETAAEAEVVQRAGCALAQGYHFGGPLTAAELEELLRGVAAVPVPRADDGRQAESAAVLQA